MIRIALCDDEVNVLDEVSSCIRQYAENKNKQDMEIVPFDSARALLSALDEGSAFDVFILDVYIGDEMGTTLARNIRRLGIKSPIIFATNSTGLSWVEVAGAKFYDSQNGLLNYSSKFRIRYVHFILS